MAEARNPSDQPVLKVEGVSKRFIVGRKRHDTFKETVSYGISRMLNGKKGEETKEFWALKEISFSLNKGEVLGVIGRNGAGKSTLLKILSGITSPTEGRVEINGRFTSILDIGTGFHPDISGRENVFLNAELLGMSREETSERFEDIHAFSGIGDFIDQPVKQYSNGMFLRLAFSVAFHADIDLLILDEVLSVGDAEFQLKSMKRIKEMVNRGTGVVLVSHNINDVTELCTRCIQLDKGEIKEQGRTLEVVEAYISEAVNPDMGGGKGQEGAEVPEYNLNLAVPGEFAIEYLAVRPAGGRPGDDIRMENEIEILLKGRKLSDSGTIQVIFHLNNMEGNRLLVDSFALRPGFEPREMPAGNYTFVCKIPPNFLNRGFYYLNVTLAKDIVNPLETFETLAGFKVLLNPADQNNIWNQMIAASLRPYFEWEVTDENGETLLPKK